MEEDQNWNDLPNIPEFLIENLIKNSYQNPFPVQTAVISSFFNTNNDLAIGFPTGSGKTLSYLIPIISSIYKRIVPRLRVLIVVPNRELALQVFHITSALIINSKLTVMVLSTNYFSGNKIIEDQDPDILITTALGLSSYLVEINDKLLSNIEYIVLDEGDSILEQPLENWLDHVNRSLESYPIPNKFEIPIKSIPSKSRRIRKILCSATLSRNSKQSEDFQMISPLLLVASDKSRYVVPLGISEEFAIIEKIHKPAILLSYTRRFKFILCFVSTSKRCLALSNIMKKLNSNLTVIEFSAATNISQKQKALENIDNSNSRLIIATDSLARGVDLPFLDAVINFDVPVSTRTYIHRMGRTARGKNQGICITLLLENELLLFKDIISKIDGSEPIKNNVNLRGEITDQYLNIIKGFENLKIKKVFKKKININDQEISSDEKE